MTGELQFLTTITLIFIILVFYLSLKQNPIKEDEHETNKKTVQKSNDIIDALDWMLAHGIIDTKEYTKLIGKCLPFLQ